MGKPSIWQQLDKVIDNLRGGPANKHPYSPRPEAAITALLKVQEQVGINWDFQPIDLAPHNVDLLLWNEDIGPYVGKVPLNWHSVLDDPRPTHWTFIPQLSPKS